MEKELHELIKKSWEDNEEEEDDNKEEFTTDILNEKLIGRVVFCGNLSIKGYLRNNSNNYFRSKNYVLNREIEIEQEVLSFYDFSDRRYKRPFICSKLSKFIDLNIHPFINEYYIEKVVFSNQKNWIKLKPINGVGRNFKIMYPRFEQIDNSFLFWCKKYVLSTSKQGIKDGFKSFIEDENNDKLLSSLYLEKKNEFTELMEYFESHFKELSKVKVETYDMYKPSLMKEIDKI